MGKFEQHSEAVTQKTQRDVDDPLSGARDDTFSKHSRKLGPVPDVPKDFTEQQDFKHRVDAGVESGTNLRTGEPNGKALASSETLMRAESKMYFYDAINGKNDGERAQALKALGVSADGVVKHPENGQPGKVDLHDKESVYQLYLSQQAKWTRSHNIESSRDPAYLEKARIAIEYKESLKPQNQQHIEFN